MMMRKTMHSWYLSKTNFKVASLTTIILNVFFLFPFSILQLTIPCLIGLESQNEFKFYPANDLSLVYCRWSTDRIVAVAISINENNGSWESPPRMLHIRSSWSRTEGGAGVRVAFRKSFSTITNNIIIVFTQIKLPITLPYLNDLRFIDKRLWVVLYLQRIWLDQ